MKIAEFNPSERPREKVMAATEFSLIDERDLLAVILRVGVRGCNVSDLASRLISSFGGLTELVSASWREIVAKKIPGVGKVKAIELASAFELGRRAFQSQIIRNNISIRSAEQIAELVYARTHGEKQECVFAIYLDVKRRLICNPKLVTRGLLDASLVHPREIFKEALKNGAKYVVIAHNHPSGVVKPSADDFEVTRRLVQSARILGVGLVDHIVVGNMVDGKVDFCSLKATGRIVFEENYE